MDPPQFVVPGVRTTGKRKEHPSPAQSPTSISVSQAVLANAKRRGLEAATAGGGGGAGAAAPVSRPSGLTSLGVVPAVPVLGPPPVPAAARPSGDASKAARGGGRAAPPAPAAAVAPRAPVSGVAAVADASAAAPLPSSGLKHLGGIGALTWSADEDALLREAIAKVGCSDWAKVAAHVPRRTAQQCMSRWVKALQQGTAQGPWSAHEDDQIRAAVAEVGVSNVKWSELASRLPGRIGKQCRERWFNHLDPSIKRGAFEADEDQLIVEAQRLFGNRWCDIAKLLPGRTENAVKNRWNSAARKRWSTDLETYGSAPVAVPLVALEVRHAGLAALPPDAPSALLSSIATPVSLYVVGGSTVGGAGGVVASSSYAARAGVGVSGVHPVPAAGDGVAVASSDSAAAASPSATPAPLHPSAAPTSSSSTLIMNPFLGGRRYIPGVGWPDFQPSAALLEALPGKAAAITPFLAPACAVPSPADGPFAFVPVLFNEGKTAVVGSTLGGWLSPPMPLPGFEALVAPKENPEGRAKASGRSGGRGSRGGKEGDGDAAGAGAASKRGNRVRGSGASGSPLTLADEGNGAGISYGRGSGARARDGARSGSWRSGRASRKLMNDDDDEEELEEGEGGEEDEGIWGDDGDVEPSGAMEGGRGIGGYADAYADGEGSPPYYDAGVGMGARSTSGGVSPSEGDGGASLATHGGSTSAGWGAPTHGTAHPHHPPPPSLFQPPTLAINLASPANGDSENGVEFPDPTTGVPGMQSARAASAAAAAAAAAGAAVAAASGYHAGSARHGMMGMASPFGVMASATPGSLLGAGPAVPGSGSSGGYYQPLQHHGSTPALTGGPSAAGAFGYPSTASGIAGRPSIGPMVSPAAYAAAAQSLPTLPPAAVYAAGMGMSDFDPTGSATRARMLSPAGLPTFPGAASAAAWGTAGMPFPAQPPLPPQPGSRGAFGPPAPFGYAAHPSGLGPMSTGTLATGMGDLSLYNGVSAVASTSGGALVPSQVATTGAAPGPDGGPATVKFRLNRMQLRELGIFVARGERLTPEQMKLAMERLEQVGKNGFVQLPPAPAPAPVPAPAPASPAPAPATGTAKGAKGSAGARGKAGKGGKEKASATAEAAPSPAEASDVAEAGGSATARKAAAKRSGKGSGAATAADSPSKVPSLPSIPEAATLAPRLAVETGVLQETGGSLRPTRSCASGGGGGGGFRSSSRNSANSASPRSQTSVSACDQLRLDRIAIEDGDDAMTGGGAGAGFDPSGAPGFPALPLPLETPGSMAGTPVSGPLTLAGVGDGAQAPQPMPTLSWTFPAPGQALFPTAAPSDNAGPAHGASAAGMTAAPAQSPLSNLLPQLHVDTGAAGAAAAAASRYAAGLYTLQQQPAAPFQHHAYQPAAPGGPGFPGSPNGQPFQLGAITFLPSAGGAGARGFPMVLSPTNGDQTSMLFAPSTVAAWQLAAASAATGTGGSGNGVSLTSPPSYMQPTTGAGGLPRHGTISEPPPLEPVPADGSGGSRVTVAATTVPAASSAGPSVPTDDNYSFLVPASVSSSGSIRHPFTLSYSPLSSPASSAMSANAFSVPPSAPLTGTGHPDGTMHLSIAVATPLSHSGSDANLAALAEQPGAAPAATAGGAAGATAGGGTLQVHLRGIPLPTPSSSGPAGLDISVVVSTSSSSSTPGTSATPSTASSNDSNGNVVTTTTTTTTTTTRTTVLRGAAAAAGGGAGAAVGAGGTAAVASPPPVAPTATVTSTAMKPDIGGGNGLFTTRVVDTYLDTVKR